MTPIRRSILILGVVACLSGRAFAAILPGVDEVSMGTYYVDGSNPACSDAGPGTEAQPYCTISAAVTARAAYGVTILVKPGVYPEQVTLPASGGPNARFQLRALPGGVVIDGADLFANPAKWVLLSGNVWLARDVTWSPGQVFADGARLAPSSAAPAALPARSFRWVSGDGLYVNAGGGNPAGHQAGVGHRAYGFKALSKSWVTIDGFTVTGTDDSGIYLWGPCDHFTLAHDTIRFANRMGIQVVGGSDLLLSSNTVSDNQDHGIALSGGGSGFVLEDNESFRNARPTSTSADGINVANSPGTTLRRNRLHDNQDSGLRLQGSNGCVSYLNMSWNNGVHGYDHFGSAGATHVCDVAYGNRSCGFMFQSNSTGASVYNCISSNNGLTTGAYDLLVSISSVGGLASDDNVFWNSTGQSPVKYGTSDYASVATYGTQSGQDAQTLQADPRFVNPAAGDFHLLAGSPAIDDANSSVAQWPALDADGRPRADDPTSANAGAGPVKYADRGALEYIPTDQAPQVFAPYVISSPEGSPLTITVHAADSDGQPVTSLTADLSGLPAGANAVFTIAPGDTSGTLTWTPGYDDAGTYTLTFTAANGFSGSTTTTINVTNVDRAPVVAAPAAAVVAEGAPLTVVVHAADPDGQPIGSLSANLAALPPGATFTPAPGDSAGTLSWTPGYNDAGTYTVAFSAANALSGTASTAITVTNTDRAPVVTAPAAATAAEGTPLTLVVHAADPDGQPITALTADLSALPPGATFAAAPGDTTGLLSWTPGYNDAGAYTVAFTAANALTGTASTAITVSNTDRAPVVAAPATAVVAEASPLTLVVRAADPDGQPITALTADLSALPPGATFAAAPGDTAGTLSWTPGFSNAGTYTVTFTAANALSGAASTAITVSNTDRAPLVVAPATATVAEASPLAIVVHAADPDSDAITALTADLSALPKGATFTAGPGDTTGTLSWTPGYPDSGTYSVTFTAANALSGTASTTITVAKVDQAPVVTAPATVTVGEGSPLTITLQAADPNHDSITSLTADLSSLPPGSNAVFTPGPSNTTGTLAWTPTYHDAGTYSVTFTAANGLSGSATTAITVTNVNAPPTVTAPSTVAATEASPLTVTVQAGDADGEAIASLTANLSALPPGNNAVFTPGPGNTTGTLTWTPTFADSGRYTVTFTAANALSGSASSVIAVANLDRPPAVTAPAAATVREADALTITVQAADPDGDAITSLSANLSGLPPGANAVFTPGPGNATGTLTWTPTYADSGQYTVQFTAANALSGAASTAITVTDVYHPYDAGMYYVDISNPACSDQGPGTEARPYCSISAATAAHAGPGTAIVVKPGIYRERVEISTSGSPDSMLIFHASGDGVVIDGADDFSNPGLWAPYSGNVWNAASVDWGPKQVFVDGARLTPSTSTPDALTPGTFCWVLNAGLYVNTGGGNPASHQILVGHRKSGFIAYAEEWLTIEGFTVTHMEDRSILLDENCDNAQILHNTVTFGNRYGIQLSGGYGFTIGGNTVSDNNDHGISLVNGVTESVIEDNESFRNARPTERAANGIYVNASSDNLFRRNRLHHNQDTGLHFQSNADDNVSYLNRSWSNGDHGYDHLGASGTIHICDVAYGNYKDGFSIEGAAQRTQIYDSIAIENGLGTNEFDLWVDLASTPGFASDNNVFWNSTGQPPVKYITTLYSSVADYSAASGRDANTLQADPRFVNPVAGDFHLNAGSPAIDNANSSVPSWPDSDAEGKPRCDDPMRPNAGAGPVLFADRGAFEYRPAVLAVTPASGTAPLVVTANAAGSLGPDGTAVSYRFDFGDGMVVGPQPGPTATHTYAPGNWTATVTVTSQSGGTCAAIATVAVNARPTAALTASPSSGDAPLTASFDASGSKDSDGTIVSYRFDFGDGASVGPQASPTASHTFAAGTWSPSVTVTDNGGGTSTASTTVMSLNTARHPPAVVAPPAVSVAEASALTMTIHAADPDGEVISALTCDLKNLPAGNNAVFTPGPGDSSGILTWTPTYSDSGSYTVTFVAANDQAGTATTMITVTNVDRAPLVTAPPIANVVVGNQVTVQVTAADPDGDPITALTADLSSLPAGNNAAFVAAAGDTAGTLTWTPAAGDSGNYGVTFTAANARSASGATSIHVKGSNLPPNAALTAAPTTGNEPLSVTADASGSSDPDGRVVSYRFDFGDGTVLGPQSGATASHVYAAGDFTAGVTVTDEDGATGTATAHIVVAAQGSGPNLVANPSFEANTAGWAPYSGATLQRVAGGFDGAWSMKISGPATTVSFGATDSPNWVDTTPAAGTRYRFTAWVRATTAHGQARLRVREYLNGKRIGAPGYFSNNVLLSPTWQLLLIDYVAQRTASTLDLQIEDVPVAAGEEFQTDNVSIRIVPPSTAAVAAAADFKRMTPLVSVVAEEAALDLEAADPSWKVRVAVAPGPDGSIPRLSRLALRYQDREVAASEMGCVAEGVCAPLEVAFDREDLKMLFAGLPRGSDGVTATVIAEPFGGVPQIGTLAVRVLGAPEPLRPVVTPNPMRAQGVIAFATSRPGPMQAELFDASGRRVHRLAGIPLYSSGWHEVAVDGRDDGGSALAAGIYFYRIVSVDGVVTGRLVLLR